MNPAFKFLRRQSLKVFVVLFISGLMVTISSFRHGDPVNPLSYEFNKTIDFSAIKVADIKLITQQSIDESKSEFKKIYDIPAASRTFENTITALDDVYNKLSSVNTPVSFLKNVTTSKEIGVASNESIQQISQYYNEISQDPEMYRAIKEYSMTKEAQSLTGYKKKALMESLRDFKRDGMELPADKKAELKTLKDKLSSLSLAFSNNIAAYQDSMILSEKDMDGLPDSYKKAARRADGTFKVDMSYPSYVPFMENATDSKPFTSLPKACAIVESFP